MFGTSYYNQTTRRYVALFGTLFNDISIGRSDNDGVEQQRMKVPLNYGPMEKFLARTKQDPDLDAPAMTLPRMSFELLSMQYDGSRKLTNMVRNKRGLASDPNSVLTQYTPAPYNLEFQLSIMAKYTEDATKIVEQILPFFKPEFTVTAKLIDDMDLLVDIPVVLNSVNVEDSYEGSFEERRAIIWTLTFTLKGYYYGPTSPRKIIKFVDVGLYDSLTAANTVADIYIQPGLTANGEPTTSITETIPYADINIDDDWAYIVRIEEHV